MRQKDLKIFLFLTVLFSLFSIPIINSYFSNSLSDSSTSKNYSFTGNQNITDYLRIIKYATVKNAQLNLSSYGKNYIDSVNAYQCSDTWDAFYGCDKVVDGNWGSFGSGNGIKAWITINYTLDFSFSELNLTIKHNTGEGAYFEVDCWNGTAWEDNWLSVTKGVGIINNTGIIPNSCYKTPIYLNITTSGAIYEGELIVNNSVINPYLDVGNNGNKEWEYSGVFNQLNNRTSNFSTEIQLYLSSCSNLFCDIPLVLHSDTAGIIQISDINITYTTPLFWLNNSTNYPSPQIYSPTRNYGFEVEWNNYLNNYSISFIEHNFTGTLTNYTTSKSGNISYYNFTGISSGTYQYRFYANDSFNNWNKTDIWFYTINKATPFINLFLNETEDNFYYFFNLTYNFTASTHESLQINLTTNMTGWTDQSNTTTVSNTSKIVGYLNNTYYNITAFTNGNENYTAGSETHYAIYWVTCSPFGYTDCLLRTGCLWLGDNTTGYCTYATNITTTTTTTTTTTSTTTTTGGGGATTTTTTTTTTVPSTTTTLPSCSWSLNSLNDSSTSKNLTFTGNQNQTVYITIPKYYTADNAQLNLTGYNISGSNIVENDTESEFASTDIGTPQYAHDGNWETEATRVSSGVPHTGYIYENYTTIGNATYGNLTFKWAFLGYYTDLRLNNYTNITMYCWNYSSSDYIKILQNMTTYNIGETQYYNTTNINIPIDCFKDKDRLILKTIMEAQCGDGCSGTGDTVWLLYYETKIAWSSDQYPTNPYLDVGNIGDSYAWVYSGILNQSTQTSDFSNKINNILPSCSCSGCSLNGNNCTIPLVLHSDTSGIIQISNINIQSSLGTKIRAYDEQTLERIYFNAFISNETNSYYQNNTWEISTTCGNSTLPTGNLTVQISDPNGTYVERFYYLTLNQSFDLNTYLLKKSDGIYITFLVVDSSNKAQPNVKASMRRYLNNTWTTVAQLKSDSQGKGWFFLYPWANYKTQAETNYVQTYIDSYYPNSNYVLVYVLGQAQAQYNLTYVLDDISYFIEPNYTYVDNTTRFKFYISASKSDLEYFGLNISWVLNNNETLLYNQTSTNPAGGEIWVDVNLTSLTGNLTYGRGSISVIAWFKKTGYDLYLIKKDYTIWYEFSILPNIFSSISSGTFGLSSFATSIIALIISAIVSVGITKKLSSIPTVVPFLLMLAVFCVATWFNWYLYIGLIILSIGIIIYQRVY